MKQSANQDNIRIVKINSCNSLSGKSTLEYQIGCTDDANTFVRIVKNSGGGWFSKDWISLKLLITTLESSTQLLTSFTFQPLYKGTSVNTAAFIFAALKEEGLVITSSENPRCYVLQSVENFMQPLKALIASGVSLKDTSAKASKASANAIAEAIPVLISSPKTDSNKTKAQANKA